jgi:hypothetical protein
MAKNVAGLSAANHGPRVFGPKNPPACLVLFSVIQAFMLALLRRIARLLGFVVVVAIAAPAVALDCRELSAMSGDRLPCCKPSGTETGLNADCCAVRSEQAGSTQPPATAAARSASDAVLAPSTLLPFDGPAPLPGFAVSNPADTGPPSDRLYIRFSVIRR